MSAAQRTIWVSTFMENTALYKFIDSDVWEADLHQTAETTKKVFQGIPQPQELFPKKLWGKYRERRIKPQSGLFLGGGFWNLPKAMADVMRQFNLGQTTFYPVELFQHDRVTPVEGTYECIAFGEQKSVFVPEYSPKAHRIWKDRDIWRAPYDLKDRDIALREEAFEGVDLWIDPSLRECVFLSGELLAALKEAKMTRTLTRAKCRIIQNN